MKRGFKKNGWKPCNGCEEVCDQIWKLLVGYLLMMDYAVAKESIWAFWRTFCAFSVRENDALVLELLYDNHMNARSKENVTKAKFVTYMTREV